MQAVELSVSIDWKESVCLCNGNPDFMRELLSILAEELKVSKDKLLVYYTKKDMGLLEATLHRIEQAISYFKLPQLANALRSLDESVKQKPYNFQRLEEAYTELQRAIKVFLEIWDVLEASHLSSPNSVLE